MSNNTCNRRCTEHEKLQYGEQKTQRKTHGRRRRRRRQVIETLKNMITELEKEGEEDEEIPRDLQIFAHMIGAQQCTMVIAAIIAMTIAK